MLQNSLTLLLCYLLGSIPTSFIIGKMVKGIDIRQYGSGNVGATNALRVLGIKIGVVTLIIDILKGYSAILLAKSLLNNPSNLMIILCGLAAILGHIFTIFLKFKGGKGVATSAGVFIGLISVPVIFALLVFVITVSISRYVSLGSIFAAITLFIAELFINIHNHFQDKEILIFVFLICTFIIYRHHANIKRLIAGNENKISFKK